MFILQLHTGYALCFTPTSTIRFRFQYSRSPTYTSTKTYNARGFNGDWSPNICVKCDFMIHQDWLALPRLIKINWDDHRLALLFLVLWILCVEFCRKKMKWTCGGYFCKKCSGYVVHSKCVTRPDGWNVKKLKDYLKPSCSVSVLLFRILQT